MANTLYYGDNLSILRNLRYFADECVSLIYLDPPFNSNRDYNVIFKEESGAGSPAQIKAFTDTWKWNEAAYHEFVTECTRPQLIELMKGFVNTLGRNDVTAYLVMMAPRLLELHRVLKATGSIYLHCDPTASHYLKTLMDVIFGPRNFQNEVVWWYRKWSASDNRFLRNHDILLFYAKNREHIFNVQYVPLAPSTLKRFGGKRQDFADEDRTRKITTDEDSAGSYMPDVWPINLIPAQSAERLGYPTQKPLALLERIVLASSNKGDVILDPFCGCGTAIAAAEKHGRKWLGIDITHLATTLIKYRMADSFGLKVKKDYEVKGEPTTASEARALAIQDRDEFQRWAIGLVNRARLFQEKKGADSGIDGILYINDDPREDPKKCVIQVKSGKPKLGELRDFAHVMKREDATLGLFILLDAPTGPMIKEAGAIGYYKSPLEAHPIQRLQIRTVDELLSGKSFDIPRSAVMKGVKQAAAVRPDEFQGEIDLDAAGTLDL